MSFYIFLFSVAILVNYTSDFGSFLKLLRISRPESSS